MLFIGLISKGVSVRGKILNSGYFQEMQFVRWSQSQVELFQRENDLQHSQVQFGHFATPNCYSATRPGGKLPHLAPTDNRPMRILTSLRQGGNIFMFVCQQNYAKTTKPFISQNPVERWHSGHERDQKILMVIFKLSFEHCRRALSYNTFHSQITACFCKLFITRQNPWCAERDIFDITSVRLSVRHAVALCLNDCTHRRTYSVIRQNYHSSFSRTTHNFKKNNNLMGRAV